MAVTEIIVREFLGMDYPQVYRVWERSGLEMRTSDTLPELQKVLDRNPDLFLVAESEGIIVGAVLGAFDGRRGWVYHLGVDPSYQNRGIGTKLMADLLERYRANGVNKVNLMVTADNLAVCEYYKKMGFILHDYVVMGIPLQGKY
ncbi:MAG: hypothetical protein FD169_2094 [Bacillota bacterium]|nr:MAG: hypothetical protein FD169_2094 [Bacillota bacterium]MBS3949631.1 GNAT family N-acetyltransferase [Peptococcaceae bacterium]